MQAVIISGLWRGCCQTACTGGCPSCYLLPARTPADRQQVYSRVGPRVLIFCLCSGAGNIACRGPWEATSCLSPWEDGWRQQDVFAGVLGRRRQVGASFSRQSQSGPPLSFLTALLFMHTNYSAPAFFSPLLTGGWCSWQLAAFKRFRAIVSVRLCLRVRLCVLHISAIYTCVHTHSFLKDFQLWKRQNKAESLPVKGT